jgi:hypothetical protein
VTPVANPRGAPRTRLRVLLAVLLAALYAAVAGYFVLDGRLNVDEGFYGLAARAVMHGSLPYRDFGYTQTPLFPYLDGALMSVLGFGFVEQRLAASVWAAATVAVGAAWMWRRVSPAAAGAFALITTASLQWVYFSHLGKATSFVSLMVLSATLVVLSGGPFRRRIALLSLFGVLAVGARLPMGPYFAFLWIGILARDFSWMRLLEATAWPIGLSAALLLPFAAADPSAFVFWTLDFHVVSRGLRDWSLGAGSILGLAPAAWIGLAAVGSGAAVRRRLPSYGTCLVCSGLLAAAAAVLLPRGAYPEYAAPLVPSLLVVVTLGLFQPPTGLRTAWAAIAGLAVASLTSLPPTEPSIYLNVKRAARAVNECSPKGAPFVGSATILALESGRSIPGDLVMGSFACTEDYPETEARRLHLATPGRLLALMGGPAGGAYAIFNQANLNFVWSMPSFRPISRDAVRSWAGVLDRDFSVAYSDSDFVVFARKGAAVGAKGTGP